MLKKIEPGTKANVAIVLAVVQAIASALQAIFGS